jgi:uncharacterized protein (TIGR02231 family)
MNKHHLVFVLLIIAVVCHAQSEKQVESRIANVTVFLNRAQVTREAKTRIEAGKTTLILGGLTSNLDPQSIQVTGRGSFVLLGTSHQQNFLNDLNQPKVIKALKDSLAFFQREIGSISVQKEILNKEEQMMLSNQKIGGANQNLTAAELKAMADFYRTRLNEIAVLRTKYDEKIGRLNDRQQKLQLQLNSQNELFNRNTSEIVISVSAETATAVELEVSYVVANANWFPVYDLRAVNTKQPIQLNYKANVQQSTGEDWSNVHLKLSTTNPSLGGLKPELNPWYLNFSQPLVGRSARFRSNAALMKSMASDSAPLNEIVVSAPLETMNDHVSTIQTSIATEFDISLPYSVASSSKPTVVDIRKYDVKADYLYASAPKLDNDAFLLAKVTGWEEYNLLPGVANIFFEGTFVGKSYIDPTSVKDTLSVSLGRDKRIVVKREKLKDLTSRNFIGSTKKETFAYEVTVRNTKSESIKIVLEDQIPVSQNSQIEVNMLEYVGAKFNKDSGKLSWEMELKPNETRKLTYKFEVKYPKDKQVSGL